MSEAAATTPMERLGEQVDLLAGFAFKSASYTTRAGAIRLVRGDNIIQGRLRWDSAMRWPMDQVAGIERYCLELGDVVIAMDRPWIEAGLKYARIGEDDLPALLVQRVSRLRGKGGLDQAFLYCLIGSREFTDHVLAVQTGTAVPHISSGQILDFRFRLPSLGEQRAIAGVLGALDDKIEQNRRTAQALARLAQAIFRAWFVDFEPVKAKAAGAFAFPSMPQAVFDALPTRFVDSNIGPVPEGWSEHLHEVSELEHRGWLQIGDGFRAKRSELAAAGLPFIRAGNVDGTIKTEGAELIGEDTLAKVGTKRSQAWDTVFTSKGTVGRLGLVTPAIGAVVYSPQVCFWRSKDAQAINPFFLHLWLRSESFTNQWMAVKGQTDMADFVSLLDQRAMDMQLPEPQLQAAFASIVEPVIRLRGSLDSESGSLGEMRDYLLPKLLGGDVRVDSS